MTASAELVTQPEAAAIADDFGERRRLGVSWRAPQAGGNQHRLEEQ